jgi:photosystem II stability/assembly factor-like uncharacterized protein
MKDISMPCLNTFVIIAFLIYPLRNAGASIGPTDDADIYAIALDPTALTTIYTGTGAGVFKSTDGGQNWVLANDGIQGETYSNMVVDPQDPNFVYMGTNGYGLYRTTNGGSNWTLGAGTYNPVVKSISIDPVNPYIVTMGAFRDIYRSYDHGANWFTLHQFPFVTGVLAIAQDPVATSTMYIGTNTQGLLKSTDSGFNWVSTNLPGYIVGAVALDPSNHNVVFATAGDSVYKSISGGDSWSEVLHVSPGDGTAIVFDTSNPGTMYVSFYYAGVYMSPDGGANWFNVGGGLPTITATSLAFDSQNGILYAGLDGAGIWKSTDGGSTWL